MEWSTFGKLMSWFFETNEIYVYIYIYEMKFCCNERILFHRA